MSDLRDVARPRVWFEDVPEGMRPQLEGLTGGHEGWGSSDSNFHEGDWDLVVTFGGNATFRSSERLHVLSVGADYATVARTGIQNRYKYLTLRYNQETHSRSCSVPEGASASPWTGASFSASELLRRWRSLITRTIVEQLPEGTKIFWSGLTTSEGVAPLVIVGSGHPSGPAALLTQRTSTPKGLLLLLPPETTDHGAWVSAFIELLRERDPARFPAPPDWRSSREWAPLHLQAALDAQRSLAEERESAVVEFDRREADAAQTVKRELGAAAQGQHQLLAEQGDQLVDAVASALLQLGFQVQDMDTQIEEGKPKLEDLRVKDGDAPDWELIAEVKGYSKGASANDVQQILLRPMRAYITETGSQPGGVWHIVNAWANRHPSTRPRMLNGDPALHQLEDADGALIDTRDLFKAVRAVEDGTTTAADVRQTLRSARGRWEF